MLVQGVVVSATVGLPGRRDVALGMKLSPSLRASSGAVAGAVASERPHVTPRRRRRRVGELLGWRRVELLRWRRQSECRRADADAQYDATFSFRSRRRHQRRTQGRRRRRRSRRTGKPLRRRRRHHRRAVAQYDAVVTRAFVRASAAAVPLIAAAAAIVTTRAWREIVTTRAWREIVTSRAWREIVTSRAWREIVTSRAWREIVSSRAWREWWQRRRRQAVGLEKRPFLEERLLAH